MKNSVVAAIFFLVICAVASDAEAVSDFPKVDTGSKFPSAQGFSLVIIIYIFLWHSQHCNLD